MQDFTGKKIVVGLCGGIAAYKSAYLVRELIALGAEIRVVMTESAQAFITPLTLQALSGHEVRTTLFDPQAERAMGHIELARWADYLLIAPASANCIAKLARGLADDLLSTLFLVCEAPVLICPAMNRSMWSHPATQQNIQMLEDYGCSLIGPDQGSQACGEFGYGRMSEVEEIIDGLRLAEMTPCLSGRKICITAGPTRESIDPVRYLSNHSSGKMGFALAKAAKRAGAEVTLITGPTHLPDPEGVDCHHVISAEDMLTAVKKNMMDDVIFIGSAAVADFRADSIANQKIKKGKANKMQLELTKNPDILAYVAQSKRAAYVVGFAAETHDVIEHAQSKLDEKQLDLIVANQVGDGLGFNQDIHEVTFVTSSQKRSLQPEHKVRIAGEIIQFIAKELAKNEI